MATTRGLIWPEPAPSGTLWVDPATGNAYRRIGRRKQRWTLYAVNLTKGGTVTTGYVHRLPKGVVCVFFPEETK